jgi:hypothetical protein
MAAVPAAWHDVHAAGTLPARATGGDIEWFARGEAVPARV